MGSSSSKVARAASGPAKRVYPSRVPPTVSQQTSENGVRQQYPEVTASSSSAPPPGPRVHPPPHVSEAKDEAINLDATDPVYASQLRTLGVVSSNPFQSNSSTNPLEQRQQPPTPTASSLTPTPSPTSRRPREPAALQQTTPPQGAFPHPLHNPVIAMLQARQRLQDEADAELQSMRKAGFAGRTFLDTSTIQSILSMRDDRGMGEAEIEKRLELKPGTVGRLGPKGLVEATKT